jgi:hypothetical protein
MPTMNPAGDLDVFYMTFYSYNLGPNVLGERFGNHVGDWGAFAHTRLQRALPIAAQSTR